MIKIKLYISLCSLVIILACNNTEYTITDKKINLPEAVETFNPNLDEYLTASAGEENFKIYTLIDVSCSTCIFKLEQWDRFQSEINVFNAQVIPICYSKDKFELLKFLFETNKLRKFNLPLLLDLENEFMKENSDLLSSMGEINVLTDKDNMVILSGNPIENDKVKELYFAAMRQTVN